MIETVLLFWLGLSFVVAVAANTRGRLGVAWFIVSLIVSPLIAGLLVLALPRRERGDGPIRISRQERDRA